MASYPRNKLLTALAIARRIRNWPEAFRLRLRRHHRTPADFLAHFRQLGFHIEEESVASLFLHRK